MFTGIVQAVGEVRAITPRGGDVELLIAAGTLGLEGVAVGDSISVSGCCLTVTRLTADSFAADASLETLQVTTLGGWRAGQRVNLEKAVHAGDPLGASASDARSLRVEFEVPAPLAHYIARKGSVCIDGVSLTVNDAAQNRFGVNLIPHTLEVTTLGGFRPGTQVNVEVDIIARYLERLTRAAGDSA